MGGGLGAIIWDAEGGMGTTLMRGACSMGGMGARTCPGPRRTIEPTGGLGMTGTAGSNVVRTGGAIWNIHKNPWLEELVLLSLRLTQSSWSFKTPEYRNRLRLAACVLLTGGLGLGRLGITDGMGGWGISLGLLGPIFSLVSSSCTRPLALWMASICSCRVMLAWAACWVRAILPEWPSHVTCKEKRMGC